MMKPIAALSVLLVGASACAAPPPDEAGSQTASVTREAPASGLYAGLCGFGLAGYDPAYAIRFLVTTTVSDGSLTLSLAPLSSWDLEAGEPRPPATVGQATVCGPAIATTTPVAKGTFSAHFDALDLPSEANSIVGEPVRIENLTLDGIMTEALPERFCSGIAGMMTVPLEYELLREENTCIFVKVADGDPLPALTADDFHCP